MGWQKITFWRCGASHILLFFFRTVVNLFAFERLSVDEKDDGRDTICYRHGCNGILSYVKHHKSNLILLFKVNGWNWNSIYT